MYIYWFIAQPYFSITQSEKKWNHLPLDATELLRIAHDLAEVDVEHVAAVFDHDVVVVAVADAQNECGDTPAGAGVKEVHHGLKHTESRHQRWRHARDILGM